MSSGLGCGCGCAGTGGCGRGVCAAGVCGTGRLCEVGVGEAGEAERAVVRGWGRAEARGTERREDLEAVVIVPLDIPAR